MNVKVQNFNATTTVQRNKKNPEKRVVYLLKKKRFIQILNNKEKISQSYDRFPD